MSDKTLVGARGLNSIADPSSFRGTSGRGVKSKTEEPVRDKADSVEVIETEPTDSKNEPEQVSPDVKLSLSASRIQAKEKPKSKPSAERRRRELSVPLPIFEMVAKTKQNPTDLVLRAVRNHGEDIATGEFARGVHRGRKRLRLTVTDEEFDKIGKIGTERGWNRSETVAVLLEAELNSSSKPDDTESSVFPI